MYLRTGNSFVVILVVFLSFFTIKAQNTQVSSTPLADHHAHIWSLQASQLVTEPLPPAVELPPELAQLLREKERLSKQRSVDAIKDLYTNDLVALDPGVPIWLKGDPAIRYIAESTVINTLRPTAYSINGSDGYVAGT